MPTRGSVLVLGFGPVQQSYVATSYPHRIRDADLSDKRTIHHEHMPKSLARFLDDFKRKERDGVPRYVMNVATFAPIGSPDWNGATAEDPATNLWYVYYWMNRGPGRRWNGAGVPPPGYVSHLISEFKEGVVSHVAFGPTRSQQPECIFLRNTADDERWQYQWTGLPFLCERNVLHNIEGSTSENNGVNEWVGGRLRGITFGPSGNHIVFRERQYDWNGMFPPELAQALLVGADQGWTINTCVLNPRNPYEYVLAFNEADGRLRVWYALHQSFTEKFEEIIKEWADGKRLPVKTQPKMLTDEECRHNLDIATLPDLKPSTSRQRSYTIDATRQRLQSFSSGTTLTQRPSHQSNPSDDSTQSSGFGYGTSRQTSHLSIQQPTQDTYTNGSDVQPPYPGPTTNPGPDRVASPSELQGSAPAQPYPPHGRSRITQTTETPESPPPVHHITNNYYGKQPRSWGFLRRSTHDEEGSKSQGRKNNGTA